MPTVILSIPLLIFVAGIYFFPTFVASRRRHNNTVAIGVLNLLLGWTVLGWIIALVWSLTADTAWNDARKYLEARGAIGPPI